MYAIIDHGGRQYKVEKEGTFLANRSLGKPSSTVKFKHVLFAKERNSYHVGAPYIKDAYVSCDIVSHPRAKKVIAFKYKRRKDKKLKIGHRQDLTLFKVKEIKV